MSASQLSDLLPIEASNTQPNAYEVFGLTPGEQDAGVVNQAMKQIYEQLKAAKGTADPPVWKQALKLVEDARKLLGDPERRCALDSSLGVQKQVAPVSPEPSAGGPSDDPLASLLPKSTPQAAPAAGTVSTGAAASQGGSAAAVLGVPPLGTPPPATASSPAGASAGGPATPQIVTDSSSPAPPGSGNQVGQSPGVGWAPPKAPSGRRKKKSAAPTMIVFGSFVLIMLGAIVGLMVYLQRGGRVAVNPTGLQDGKGLIVSEPAEPDDVQPAEPRKVKDGVLDNPATSGRAEIFEREDNPGAGGLSSVDPLRNGGRVAEFDPGKMGEPNGGDSMKVGAMNPTPPKPTPPKPAPPKPAPPKPAPPMGQDTTPMPDTSAGSGEPSPEVVSANQKQIEAVEQLIRSANWAEMKKQAVELEKLPLNAQQKQRAESLYDITDLAVYYRGAVERGLETLETGAAFDYVDGVKLIVVEATSKTLTVRFNARSKTFEIDDLPPRLTEKIAAFALTSDSPDSIAALALYRLILPLTSDEYREDSWKLLESVDGQLKTVDSKALQQVAKEILSK